MFSILKKFQGFFDFCAVLFGYSLILYLVLFLLENLFPGFVTNSFDLNYFLIPVVIFGLLAVFAKEQKSEEEKANRGDFVLTGVLGIIGFLVLFYKTHDMGMEGLWISLGGSVLVVFMSLVVLLMPDEDEAEKEMPIVEARPAVVSHFKPKFNYRKLVIPTVVFLVLISFMLFKFVLSGKKPTQVAKTIVAPTATLTPSPTPLVPALSILKNTPIFVSDSLNSASASAQIIDFLKMKNFNVVTVVKTSAENENFVVRFRPEDSYVADYLVSVLSNFYKDIYKAPLPGDISQIMVILGARK